MGENMVEKVAIILTAGVGSRLKDLTKDSPKTLIPINEKSILDYQIDLYTRNGFDRIIIVSGYLSEKIEKKLENSENIHIVNNIDFRTTNNMYSLNMGLEYLYKEFGYCQTWISNGDVIYEKFDLLENCNLNESGIYVDRSQYYDESMKVIVDQKLVTSISKGINEEDFFGVSMDMYRFTPNDIEFFHNTIKGILESGELNQWTEVAIQNMISQGIIKFHPIDASGTVWWEIDDQNDIIRATSRLDLLQIVDRLHRIKLFIYDMDGTINNGMKPLGGVIEFLSKNNSKNIKNVILSNNSSYSKIGHRARVKNIFQESDLFNDIISSNDQMIDLLKQRGMNKCFFLLPEDVVNEYEQNGIMSDEVDPDLVIVGFDKEITYEKLVKASLFIQNGKDYYLVHKDLRCPTDQGFIPDAGSISRVVELTTNIAPSFTGGKPHQEMIDFVIRKFNIGMDEIAFIGDRFSTDMMFAVNSGILGLAVLTGEETLVSFDKNKKKYDTENNIFLMETFNNFNNFLSKHN